LKMDKLCLMKKPNLHLQKLREKFKDRIVIMCFHEIKQIKAKNV